MFYFFTALSLNFRTGLQEICVIKKDQCFQYEQIIT